MLDAADMGVVEVDPAELARYRANQKQTHKKVHPETPGDDE